MQIYLTDEARERIALQVEHLDEKTAQQEYDRRIAQEEKRLEQLVARS